jgi:hypothetical protein
MGKNGYDKLSPHQNEIIDTKIIFFVTGISFNQNFFFLPSESDHFISSLSNQGLKNKENKA